MFDGGEEASSDEKESSGAVRCGGEAMKIGLESPTRTTMTSK
jgi:hypothetical protein